MDTSTIAPIEDIEAAHGFPTDATVSFSLLTSQLPLSHIDRSVEISSTIQILDDVDSRASTYHDIDHGATAPWGDASTSDYVMMAAVFAMIIFLWVQ